MPADLVAEERQADAWYSRIGPVVGREHAGKGLGLEDRAVLAGATSKQRRHVAGHVAGGRVDRSGADTDDVTVPDRVWAIGTQSVSRREARPNPLRSQQVGVGHAERLEDVLA
jgi:hypothetical protein